MKSVAAPAARCIYYPLCPGIESQVQRQEETLDPIKDAALAALGQILDSLVELMFDAGVTVQEFTRLVRGSAVKIAAKRLSESGARATKSRLAITTGLSRAEVARILRVLDTSNEPGKSYQYPARRILAAWFDNPKFLDSSGEPAILPIFGRKKTFESLVRQYGGGLPVRAMLDELTQMNVIEHLTEQRIKVRSRLPVSAGLTSAGFRSIGERGSDLLNTVAHNLRQREASLFEATALIEDADPANIPLLRREITTQSANFVNTANALLQRSRARKSAKPADPVKGRRLGVTVFYFQETPIEPSTPMSKPKRRKNLRRPKSKASASTNGK